MTPKATRAQSAARLILVSAALALPTLSLIPLGGLYLWQSGYLLIWAVAALATVLTVYLIERTVLKPSDVHVRPESQPHATWTPLEERAWQDVQEIARTTDVDKLDSGQSILDLGQATAMAVARRLHSGHDDAVWRFTLPEALAITERVSHQLAHFVVRNVPFGDRITVSQFMQIYRWRHLVDVADRAYDFWRIVRLANPATAMTHEARERLSRAFLSWGREHVSRRLVQEYVEEVGRAAIDLYGGRLRLALPVESAAADFRDPHATGALLSVAVIGGRDGERRDVVNYLRYLTNRERLAAATAGSDKPSILSALDLDAVELAAWDQKDVVDAATGADIVFAILPPASAQDRGTSPRQALKSIAAAIGKRGDRVSPIVIPVMPVTANSVQADPADVLGDDIEGVKVFPALRLDLDDGDDDAATARISELLQNAMPFASRAQYLRTRAERSAQSDWRGAAWQAASAVGSIAKGLVLRRKPAPAAPEKYRPPSPPAPAAAAPKPGPSPAPSSGKNGTP